MMKKKHEGLLVPGEGWEKMKQGLGKTIRYRRVETLAPLSKEAAEWYTENVLKVLEDEEKNEATQNDL